MSLDISLIANKPTVVFDANITHNLNKMADAVGIYKKVWRPEECGISKASDLIPFLRDGIFELKQDPEKYKKLNPENGWGDYDGFVAWLEKYLSACIENPEAKVQAWI